MQFICFNHSLIAKSELSFYEVERFRVADACFESMLLINQKIPLLAYHQARLNKTCRALGFDSYKIDESLILKLAAKNNFTHGAVRVRLSLVRALGKNYTPFGSATQNLLELESITTLFTPVNNLGIYTQYLKQSGLLSTLKHSNALLYVLAKQYALKNQLDDALISNESGHCIEASSSNLFIIKNEEIYSPPDNSGCVLGVSRACILNFLDVKLVELDEKMVFGADEIFLSNGIQLIQPVQKLLDKELKNSITKNIITQIKRKLEL